MAAEPSDVVGELAVAVRERGRELLFPEPGRLAVRSTLFSAIREINRVVPGMMTGFINYTELDGFAGDRQPPRWTAEKFYAKSGRERFSTSKSFLPYLSSEWAFNMQMMLSAMCCIPYTIDGQPRWKFMNVAGGYDKCLSGTPF